LLGDADQLASVEAGAVLGEICSGGASRRFSPEAVGLFRELGEREVEWDRDASPLDDCIVELDKSSRFTEGSAIGLLSAAIKAGDGPRVVSLLTSPDDSTVTLQEPVRDQKLASSLRQRLIRGFRAYLEAPTAEAALAAFDGYRILCAHRRGPYGVQNLNPLVEQTLSAARLIERPTARYYRGRPVLVQRNDYHIGLFNGDIGMVWPDSVDPTRLKTVFATAGGSHRRLVPARLPEHETVFAMSIHKSQGSEFDEVTIVLPDRESPLCTRELLYTAVTRARRGLAIVATPETVERAVLRSVARASGLSDALRTSVAARE
jgi:exodeoxyribonuclease V alpha subunit